ncbi:MAG: homoserine dehydrogenase [Planctomycetes bacterium]|nr:homoserine dehydrogenase [Planctomycetota bacterium]
MSDVRTIRVAMAGCGTVGGGIAEIVVNRADALASRTGLRFEIVRSLVSDASKRRDVPLASDVFTSDATNFIATDADMLVEVIGGTSTARDVVLASLAKGVPVVTANKALLAQHGAEVYQTARKANTCVAFEASCAGGLPIIGALLRGLQANRNDSIMGIFNSTCNYILSEMLDGGATYEDALRSAQKLGYAEADPTLDVGGGDTAHKLAILASLAFGLNLDVDEVETEGIANIELRDLQIAQQLGYACKLLGIGRLTDWDGKRSVSLRVHPTLVPHSNALAGMGGTYGAVVVRGDVVGETLYAGAGAGSLPTASAVVADMIDVASGAAQKTFDQICAYNDRTPAAMYVDTDDCEYAYYVRVFYDDLAVDKTKAVEQLKSSGVRWQRLEGFDSHDAVVGITVQMPEREFKRQYSAMRAKLQPTREPIRIRILPTEVTA